ncbi:putative CCT motif family protein [Tanacetum coccineum]
MISLFGASLCFFYRQEQVSSPLSAQLLEFCESDLFPETIQNSEVASSSNFCYDEQSSFPTADITKYPTPIDNTKPPTSTNIDTDDINNFSLIFDEEITENDIDFITSPNLNLPAYQFGHQDQFDLTILQNQIDHATNINNGPIQPYPNDHVVPIIGPTTLSTVCEDDCLSSMPPSKLMRLNNATTTSASCSFMDPSLSSYLSNPPLPLETFNANLFLGDLDFKGDNVGIFCQDPLPPPYNASELQALSNESQHLVNGGGSSTTPLASEITSTLEADTFRVTTTKLTTEERKEKIHRYMKKRNERNFSKKIKYACRKTLADSRPRVRGRFAKNDEFGENNRTCSNHEEDTDEDLKSFQVVVKEEEHNFDTSDIFAHLSGVNSFKCNYPIQSWM